MSMKLFFALFFLNILNIPVYSMNEKFSNQDIIDERDEEEKQTLKKMGFSQMDINTILQAKCTPQSIQELLILGFSTQDIIDQFDAPLPQNNFSTQNPSNTPEKKNEISEYDLYHKKMISLRKKKNFIQFLNDCIEESKIVYNSLKKNFLEFIPNIPEPDIQQPENIKKLLKFGVGDLHRILEHSGFFDNKINESELEIYLIHAIIDLYSQETERIKTSFNKIQNDLNLKKLPVETIEKIANEVIDNSFPIFQQALENLKQLIETSQETSQSEHFSLEKIYQLLVDVISARMQFKFESGKFLQSYCSENLIDLTINEMVTLEESLMWAVRKLLKHSICDEYIEAQCINGLYEKMKNFQEQKNLSFNDVWSHYEELSLSLKDMTRTWLAISPVSFQSYEQFGAESKP